MVETFLLTLFTLIIGLYVQARKSAREIRRSRDGDGQTGSHRLILAPSATRAKSPDIW